MTSKEECDKAYQFLGYPEYDNYLPKEEFFERLAKAKTRAITSEERLLVINARRSFNICINAQTKKEADDLSQTYFDRVKGIEISTHIYKDQFPYERAVIEVFKYSQKLEGRSVYGFQPLIIGSYLYKKKRDQGYILVKKRHLSSRIKFDYLPPNAIDKKTSNKIWFLVPKSFLKSKLYDLEKYIIKKKNEKDIYSINGKYCFSKPKWDYWSWVYPWLTYAAWVNPEQTEWDWVLSPTNRVNKTIDNLITS